jgi:hypothetical protein
MIHSLVPKNLIDLEEGVEQGEQINNVLQTPAAVSQPLLPIQDSNTPADNQGKKGKQGKRGGRQGHSQPLLENIHPSLVEKIEIRELNLEIIQPSTKTFMNESQGGSKIVVIGKPGTGKSTLIGSLLYSKKHIIPVAMAMSGTEDSNSFYKSVLPSTFVFNKYDEKQIEKFIMRQKIAKKHLQNPWAALILDDCTDDPAVFRKPLQGNMFKNGRHFKMWYIVSLQYGLDFRPSIRTNVDGIFILREPNIRNRHVMYENYGGNIPTFKMFCDLLDQLTNDFCALYIHNATISNDWRDCVFWYKAPLVPKNFRFGCNEYWDFDAQRYNPDYVEPVTI